MIKREDITLKDWLALFATGILISMTRTAFYDYVQFMSESIGAGLILFLIAVPVMRYKSTRAAYVTLLVIGTLLIYGSWHSQTHP